MKSLDFRPYALSSCVAAVMLAGCAGSQPPIIAPGGMPQTSEIALARSIAHRMLPASYSVLYRFKGASGEHPFAGLIAVSGTLYGTTFDGGSFNLGTVYSLSTNGTEKVLHNFTGGSDGANSRAPLIDVDGTLYGTTEHGGGTDSRCSGGCGTVFSITTAGVEKVLHRFGHGSDGAEPYAPLTYVKGMLYGTTNAGGSCSCGTVYRISTSGAESVLYSFRGYNAANPNAGLINVNGTLYGTTLSGGHGGQKYSCHYTGGCGTVYRISTTGVVKVLHTFDGTDGASPQSGLIAVDGTFYGTTELGGTGFACGGAFCGTVYSITTTGSERVLYNFYRSGRWPRASLISVNGRLYGTTWLGDRGDHGIIFSVSLGGMEKVVYRFQGGPGGIGPEGSYPLGSLIDVNGRLYGTTEAGGSKNSRGRGTVFAVSP